MTEEAQGCGRWGGVGYSTINEMEPPYRSDFSRFSKNRHRAVCGSGLFEVVVDNAQDVFIIKLFVDNYL